MKLKITELFIAVIEQGRGTIDSVQIHPRELAKRALQDNAAAVIFVHNHPDGDAEPSLEDRRLTERLRKIFSELGINVHDHFIIGRNGHFSFRDAGLLTQSP